ncbi:MAG: hypothetical protein LBQ68_04250, partial [Clostridiales bacterium]|nr:hypothetical protein [Clostridiales bacterium]
SGYSDCVSGVSDAASGYSDSVSGVSDAASGYSDSVKRSGVTSGVADSSSDILASTSKARSFKEQDTVNTAIANSKIITTVLPVRRKQLNVSILSHAIKERRFTILFCYELSVR